MSALKTQFGPGWLATVLLGAANGVAPLDATGKLASSYLPSSVGGGIVFKGSYDASGALPSSPANGDFYIVSVAGSGGGTFTPALAVGDFIFYSTSASAWEPVYGPKTTDALVEGVTNLYFTAARAQAAAVINSLAASTTQAPTTSAVNTALALKANSFTRIKERFVLTSTNISNGYIILSQLALANTLVVGVQGLGMIEQSLDGGTTGDYQVATDGGTGHSKLTWSGDISSAGTTPLVAGNAVYVQYVY